VRARTLWAAVIAAVLVTANVAAPRSSASPRRADPSPAGATTPVVRAWGGSAQAAGQPATAAAQPAPPAELTVVASGDVLLHSALWRQAAADAGGRGYDFRPLFSGVRPVVSAADLAICHLETPLGAPQGPFTGYPVFVVPPQVGRALGDAGYDTCSTASNHSLDAGAAGIRRTLDTLDRAGLAHPGTYRSAREHATPTVLSVKGVPVAHLSYTFSFNGLRRPAGMPWLANDIDPATVLDEARRARAAGAQIVIVSLHWGTEYSSSADARQVRLAHRLLASPDVDLILGHHAHVVQPFERIGGKWVVYGMGNQLANQTRAVTRDGVMARMTFRRIGPDRWRVVRAEALPTWMRLEPPIRLVLVPAALSDRGTPGWLRTACAQSYRRTAAAVLSRGAGPAGLRVRLDAA
jgi:poly-gamma-glutamate capsule biosynthesis protein CapA/YwtB (metallophosphatase superfamily)